MSERHAEEIDLAPWEEEALEHAWARLGAAGTADFAVRHAPHDMTIGGKHFRGGQFVPREDYAAATREQKAALDAHAFDRAVAALSDPAAGPEAHALAFETLEGLTPAQLRRAAAALGADARGGKRDLIGAVRARVAARRGGPGGPPAPAPPAPPAPARAAGPPPHAHLAAVARAVLAHPKLRYGLADLADLKDATGLSVPELHAAVQELRRRGVLTGTAYEGRHGITPRQQAAQLKQEGESALGYVGARDHAKLAGLAGGGHG